MNGNIHHLDFAGYSIKFSPFHRDIFAVASAQHYGIVGNGKLVIGKFGNPQPLAQVLTKEACFDTAFSEEAESLVTACTGSGEILFYDFSKQKVISSLPHAHTSEIGSLDFNCVKRELLVSAGWDSTVKVWDVNRLQAGNVSTFNHHTGHVYQAACSPHDPRLIASVGSDGQLIITDTSQPYNIPLRMQHGSEVLSCDWHKYSPGLIATGSVDSLIRVWDIRNSSVPVSVLAGHTLAVRRVKCHPHIPNEIVSCSYDMTLRHWDLSIRKQINCYNHHTEFAVGLDISLFEKDQVASTGWDRKTFIFSLFR